MTNADYINVWNHETLYVTEVFTRDQILDQLGYASLAYGWTDSMSTETLAVMLAKKRIGENNAHRLIPASHLLFSPWFYVE